MSTNSLIHSFATASGAYWGAKVLGNPIGLPATRAWAVATAVTEGIVKPYIIKTTSHESTERAIATVFAHFLDAAMKWGVLAACGASLSLPYFVLLLGADALAGNIWKVFCHSVIPAYDTEVYCNITDNYLIEYLEQKGHFGKRPLRRQ